MPWGSGERPRGVCENRLAPGFGLALGDLGKGLCFQNGFQGAGLCSGFGALGKWR